MCGSGALKVIWTKKNQAELIGVAVKRWDVFWNEAVSLGFGGGTEKGSFEEGSWQAWVGWVAMGHQITVIRMFLF